MKNHFGIFGYSPKGLDSITNYDIRQRYLEGIRKVHIDKHRNETEKVKEYMLSIMKDFNLAYEHMGIEYSRKRTLGILSSYIKQGGKFEPHAVEIAINDGIIGMDYFSWKILMNKKIP